MLDALNGTGMVQGPSISSSMYLIKWRNRNEDDIMCSRGAWGGSMKLGQHDIKSKVKYRGYRARMDRNNVK